MVPKISKYCTALNFESGRHLATIKMLNRHTESHCRRYESKCKIVKLNHSIIKTHTDRPKNQRYFKNFTRFSNVFASIKSQCFFITSALSSTTMVSTIYKLVFYPVTPDETGKLTHLQHFCTSVPL